MALNFSARGGCDPATIGWHNQRGSTHKLLPGDCLAMVASPDNKGYHDIVSQMRQAAHKPTLNPAFLKLA